MARREPATGEAIVVVNERREKPRDARVEKVAPLLRLVQDSDGQWSESDHGRAFHRIRQDEKGRWVYAPVR